jgi:hypothetical protein
MPFYTRVDRNAGPYNLTHTWLVDGTATDVNTVTVGIIDAAGATVVAAGTATTDNNDGTYTYQLASQSQVKHLTATWTRSDTSASMKGVVEVVGGALFTESDARSFDNSAISSSYTDQKIAEERDRVTDLLERWTGISWIPRYCRVELQGTGRADLYIGDGRRRGAAGQQVGGQGWSTEIIQLISVTVDGVSVSTSTIDVDRLTGRLWRNSGWWTAPVLTDVWNVVVEYEYGQATVVEGVDRIGMLLLRDRLVPSTTDFGRRATSITSDLGTFRFDTPGRFGNVSSLPEVNEWVRAHSRHAPFA